MKLVNSIIIFSNMFLLLGIKLSLCEDSRKSSIEMFLRGMCLCEKLSAERISFKRSMDGFITTESIELDVQESRMDPFFLHELLQTLLSACLVGVFHSFFKTLKLLCSLISFQQSHSTLSFIIMHRYLLENADYYLSQIIF